MNPTLMALLVATGLRFGSYAIYEPAEGADPKVIQAVALDAGFVARVAEGEFRIRDTAWATDGGFAGHYVRLQFPIGVGVGLNTDGGNVILYPDLPERLITEVRAADFSVGTCAARPGVCPLYGRQRPFVVVPHLCAWKPNTGAACVRLDGGNPGVANTMQPGQWIGAGCALKACVEIAGDSSAP